MLLKNSNQTWSIFCLNVVGTSLVSFFLLNGRQTASSLSVSSDLVRGVHARASVERCSRETRETRAAAREEKFRASSVSRLQSRAFSFACLGRFARRTKKKEETARSLNGRVPCLLKKSDLTLSDKKCENAEYFPLLLCNNFFSKLVRLIALKLFFNVYFCQICASGKA